MDQIELYKKLQAEINQKENSMNKEFKAIEVKLTALIEGYYDQNITHEQQKKLKKLKQEIDREISGLYKELRDKMKQQQKEVFDLTIFSYAYMLHLFLSGDSLFPLTDKTPQSKALQGIFEERKKKVQAYKEDKETVSVLQKHKNGFVSGLYQAVTTNLKQKAGFDHVREKIKERTKVAQSHAVNRLSDWLHKAVNTAQDTIHKATKKIGSEKLWTSMRDNKVRSAHRTLDGQLADADGYFHYKGDKTKSPKKWKESSMNWGCRCKVLLRMNGKLPRTSKVRDYRDNHYNEKLQKRINEYLDEGHTLIQAVNKAQRETQPPLRRVPYVSYDDWLTEYGP